MRNTLLAGGLVAVTVAAATWVGALFGLELEPVALLGVALGAVVALVPDGRPEWRLVGFAAGFMAAWIGYVVRAAVLPDSTSGRAIAYALVVAICVAAIAAGRGRIRLWSPLVGVATLVGAYEAAYVAAPSQVVDTSLVAATAVLLTAAVGFLAASFVAPETGPRPVSSHTRRHTDNPDGSRESLDNFMVESAA